MFRWFHRLASLRNFYRLAEILLPWLAVLCAGLIAVGLYRGLFVGAAFTFLALVTGSLWGRPMWGTWWEWDARLTSELILLFIYFGYMALRSAIDNPATAARAVAILALVGVVNIPIIHYSVEWWNTLHQPASITKFDTPSIHISMLVPLLLMAVGFTLFYEANTGWVQERLSEGRL